MSNPNAPSSQPEPTPSYLSSLRNEAVESFQDLADARSAKTERSATSRRAIGRPVSPTGYTIGRNDYEKNGEYKYRSREAFKENVPNVRRRIERYQQLGRMVHPEDREILHRLEAEKQREQMHCLIERKLTIEGKLSQNILQAPEARKQQWEDMRQQFRTQYEQLHTQYVHSKHYTMQKHPNLHRYSGPNKINGPLKVMEEAFKDGVLERMENMMDQFERQKSGYSEQLERAAEIAAHKARELQQVTQRHEKRLSAMQQLLDRKPNSPVVKSRLRKTAEAYQRALAAEGSHLWKNLRGRENADRRIQTLLERRKDATVYLAEQFPEMYAGTPATIENISEYNSYLMDNIADSNMEDLENGITQAEEQFAALRERTNRQKTGTVRTALKMNRADMAGLPPERKGRLQHVLQGYLQAVKKEGSYLYQRHRDSQQDRIESLLTEQDRVKTTLQQLQTAEYDPSARKPDVDTPPPSPDADAAMEDMELTDPRTGETVEEPDEEGPALIDPRTGDVVEEDEDPALIDPTTGREIPDESSERESDTSADGSAELNINVPDFSEPTDPEHIYPRNERDEAASASPRAMGAMQRIARNTGYFAGEMFAKLRNILGGSEANEEVEEADEE